MQMTYRARWALALFSGAVGAVVLALIYSLIAVAIGLPMRLIAMVAALTSVVYLAMVVVRVRQRTLTVTEDGLIVQRDAYRVTVNWADFVEVQPKRIGGLYPVDVMTFSTSFVEPIDAKGRRRKAVPAKVYEIGADRRIQVSVYVRDWQREPVGELVTRHSPPAKGAL